MYVPNIVIIHRSYVIVSPRVVRPAEKIRISCTIFNARWTQPHLTVKALIYTDEQEIVSASSDFLPRLPSYISMKMPSNVRQANYSLRVEGRMPTGELVFSNQSEIIFEQKAVSILIQLERPDFRQDAVLRFRCIAIYPDLSPFYGTMDLFVIGPDGVIFRRWENVQTSVGM